MALEFSFRRFLLGMQALGLPTMFKSLVYALRKKGMDTPSFMQVDFWTPGQASKIQPIGQGFRVEFEKAQLEILFLTPEIARVSWEPATEPVSYGPAKKLEDWPGAKLSLQETETAYCLHSEALLAEVSKSDGSMIWKQPGGLVIRQEAAPQFSHASFTHMSSLSEDEHLFGLGQKTGCVNRRGRSFKFWNRDPGGEYSVSEDPIYLSIPCYLSLSMGASFLVFYENSFEAQFDLGQSNPKIASHTFEGGMLRYYLIAQPPEKAITTFYELTGKPPLPPLWALGYHQSRYSYYPDLRVRAIAAKFKELNLPLDVIHLDIHYMDRNRSFTWDSSLFPSPDKLCKDLKDDGIRIVTIVDPAIEVDKTSPRYQSGKSRDIFCKLPDGKTLAAPMWPGWSHFPDFTNAQARAWWAEQYQTLVQTGVSGIWNDMNEPAAFAAFGDCSLPKITRHAFDGRGGSHAEAHNLYGLLEVQATREGLMRHRQEARPFVLSRSGWAGLQRHAWHWTGDCKSDWASLRQVVPMLLGLSLSGVPYSGPDIGGFDGTPTPELYARWLQLGALLPFCRSHTIIGSPDQEPWSYGQPWLDINREAIRRRYALLPYLYTLAWQAHAQGLPLLRPLYWGNHQEKQLWNIEDAFLLGDSLLVAPILEEGATTRSLELPPGIWHDLFSGQKYKGPAKIRLEASLEQIPILVKEGTVLSQITPCNRTDAMHKNVLTLHIFPPEQTETSESLMYTDSGDGQGYPELKKYRLDRFRLQKQPGNRLLFFWSSEGEYAWPYPMVHVVCNGQTKEIVKPQDQLSFEAP